MTDEVPCIYVLFLSGGPWEPLNCIATLGIWGSRSTATVLLQLAIEASSVFERTRRSEWHFFLVDPHSPFFKDLGWAALHIQPTPHERKYGLVLKDQQKLISSGADPASCKLPSRWHMKPSCSAAQTNWANNFAYTYLLRLCSVIGRPSTMAARSALSFHLALAVTKHIISYNHFHQKSTSKTSSNRRQEVYISMIMIRGCYTGLLVFREWDYMGMIIGCSWPPNKIQNSCW